MPTGYTSAIENGITFPEFAMSCARAFGACITMRDDPADAEIPDEFKPSDHNKRALKDATARLSELRGMPPDEVKRAAAAESVKIQRDAKAAQRKNDALRTKYRAMLAEVKAWEPPTGEHAGLKKFMVEQIEESLRFDCDGDYWETLAAKARRTTPDQWLAQQIASAERDIAYHAKAHDEEVERCRTRSKWVQDLRRSLK